ncbi:MAG: hypothetical protein QM484_08765 [Woeseiaceae bacterium]
MRVKELLNEWASTARINQPVMNLNLKLPLELSAHLLALKDMYPGRTLEQLSFDLLSTAINELKETIPYQQGPKVIAEDEYGDPMYEDVGVTPRFLELTEYYRNKFNREQEIRLPDVESEAVMHYFEAVE